MKKCFCFIILFFMHIAWSTEQNMSSDSSTIDITEDTFSEDQDSLPPLDVYPELVTFVEAGYPDSLIPQGITGAVTLSLLVSEEGTVDSVGLITGLHPVLDSLAVGAATRFLFTPGSAGGKSVPVYITYEYVFSGIDTYDTIPEYENVSGRLLQKGTRKPVSDAVVVAVFNDPETEISDSSTRSIIIGTDTLSFDSYLQKAGSFEGQSFENGHLVTTSDSAGFFRFISLPPGTVLLKVIANGCKQFTDNIEIRSGEKLDLLYRIEQQSYYDDNEIVVYGKQEEKEVSRRPLEAKIARRVPGFSGDVVKAVQALPGVARPMFGSTEIIIRGADWGDNGYYVDGIPIPTLWHTMDNLSVLNSNIIESIQLYSGGFGVQYGNVLGGVIDVQLKQASKDRWHCIADINLNRASLVLQIPFSEKLSFIGSARREYFMSLVSFFAETFADQVLDFSSYYYDYSLRLDYTPAAAHAISVSLLGAKDTLFQIFSREESGEDEGFSMGSNYKLGILGWDWKLSERWKNSFRYGIGPNSDKYNLTDDLAASKVSLSGFKHTIRNNLHFFPARKMSATLGIDIQLAPTTYKSTFKGYYWEDFERKDTSFSEQFDNLVGSVGGFLSCEIKPNDNWSITPEYRLDYFPDLQYSGSLIPELWNYENPKRFKWPYEPSFRLSSRYTLLPKHTVKGSLGSYNRSPGYAANDVWGNPDLEPSRGAQYTLGYEWTISDLISFDMQGYLNHQWDKPQWVWGKELTDDQEEHLVNRGKARMRGIEFFLRHDQSSRLFGWLSYSLAYSERYDYREKKWLVFDRNILNNLQLVLSYTLPKDNNLGLRLQYTDGYPYTPVKRVLYYDATDFRYVPEYGEYNSAKHTPYIGLDLRYEKKIAFKRTMMTFYISLDRILHFLQFITKDDGTPFYFPAEYPTYNYDYSKFEGFANFPSVSFGLTLEI